MNEAVLKMTRESAQEEEMKGYQMGEEEEKRGMEEDKGNEEENRSKKGKRQKGEFVENILERKEAEMGKG